MSKVQNLPPVSEMMTQYSVFTKKSLGQHFLFDLNITNKIAKSIPNISDMHIIEIGPGPGGLTRSLLMAGARHVTVVEKDDTMLPLLNAIRDASDGRMDIVIADALKVGSEFYKNIPGPRAVCSNLPYNVGTELLVQWLHHILDFDSLTLMFQKEVAERIVANVGDNAYGRLAILSDVVAESEKLFDVDPKCFTPPPKVMSSIVQVKPKADPLNANDLAKLEKLTATLFQNRRKMIRGSLKKYHGAEDAIKSVGLSGTERPEELGSAMMVELAKVLKTNA